MGWLFGKKRKRSELPLGSGPFDEKALTFPVTEPPERTIRPEKAFKPEKIKEAVGFEQQIGLPPEEEAEESALPKFSGKKMPSGFEPFKLDSKPPTSPLALFQQPEELYIKVDIYQRIIGEISSINKKLTELSEINKSLITSEFNENSGFSRLRKLMKGCHDNLLQVDRIMFKS